MLPPGAEALYPTSPLQAGILFESLYAPGRGMYVNQMSCALAGDLDRAAFQRAWELVLARHAVLRTAFLWERQKEPVQVVHRRVTLPWEERDLSGMEAEIQAARIDEHIREERLAGFDLGRAPLLRLALHRCATDRWQFTWTWHHIVLDGWSVALLVQEVFVAYEAFRSGRPPQLPPRRPYADYLAWLRRQEVGRADQYWRARLRGFPAPTAVPMAGPPDTSSDYRTGTTEVSVSATADVAAFARRHRLTVNTLVQGAWALLLSHYSGERDVVFGTVVSGRPAALEGVDTMLGLFINTLPVRVGVETDQGLVPWLQRLQKEQAEARQYDYSPLVRVQAASDVPRGRTLFDTVVSFENYPTRRGRGADRPGLTITDTRPYSRASAALTLSVAGGHVMKLRLSSDRQGLERATLERLGEELRAAIVSMACRETEVVGAIARLWDQNRLTRAADARSRALTAARERRQKLVSN